MNPEREEILTHKIKRTDTIIKWSALGAVLMVVVTLVIIIIQLVGVQNSIQESLTQSRKNAAENHKRTQEYVRCIATTLLVPVAQRKEVDFENCANGTIDPKTGAFIPNEENSVAEQDTSSRIQVGRSPPAAAPPSTPETPPSNPPTTSAPPTPTPDETPEEPQPTIIDQLQLRLRNVLNGVESTVDTLEKGI